MRMRTRFGVAAAAIAALAAGCAAGAGATRGGGEPGAAAALQSGERPFDMPYPLQAPPKDGDIFHVPTGTPVTPEQMMDALEGARVVFVGETHDSVHAHRVELEVIRALAARHPGQVAIGMEMFREPQQEALDRWTRGELTEEQFLEQSDWYEVWSSDYGYYRDILDFARDNGLDVVALNPPRELQKEVSRAGIDALPPELAAKLPEIGPIDVWQREALKAVFGAHMKTEGMLDSFLRVQSLWEETMASRIDGYLASPRGEGKRMVVIAGGWHVRYGFGIPKKLFRRRPLSYAIVLPEELSVPEEKRDSLMEVDLPQIPLLPGDFVWLVPYEDLETGRPRMGVYLETREGKVMVGKVVPGSPAERGGIVGGDEIAAIDDRPVGSVGDLQSVVRSHRPGDVVRVLLRRDGAEVTVEVELALPELPKDHGKKE